MEREDALEKGNSTPLLRIRKSVRRSSGAEDWQGPVILLGVGCLESLAYFGISTNLVIFLGDELRQSNPSIATSIMTWTGTSFMAPFVGALLADFFCGGYWMILTSSLIELLGMALVTLSSTFRSSETPERFIFFSGLYIVALGSGGMKSSLLPLGAEQFSEENEKGRAEKSSFFNRFFFSLNLGALISSTFVVWIQQNVGWAAGYGGATAAVVAAVVVFLSGTKFYRLTMTKDLLRGGFEPEDMKFFLRLLPIWLTGVVFSTAYAHMYTTFVEQGKAMDVKISFFYVPPATLFAFEVASVMFWLALLNATFLPLAGPSSLLRTGIGYLLLAAAMAAAAAVEMNRMKKKHSLSIAWQLPQYFLVGGAEAFAYVGQMEFFYGEAPAALRSMSTAVALAGISIGNYLSSAVLAALTGVLGRSGWVPEDLTKGDLACLFSGLTGLCLLNLVTFFVFARRYNWRSTTA